MSDTKKFVLSILGILVIVIVLSFSLRWLGLIGQRPIDRYSEETRTQTYDNSRQYQQGTNRDIARYCEQMRREQSDSGKRAVAALIRSTVSSYNGTLTPDNQECVSEAKGL